MCSRYSLTSPHEAVRAYFRYGNEAVFPPRYNIAPTQPAGIVRTSEKGGREFHLVRWGLIPSWVKDPRAFSTLINARSEGVLEKPSFRNAMRHRRCLVPADGFYEWTGAAGAKRPNLIRLKAGGPFAIAGIWESWHGKEGSELDSMAILTVAANRTLAAIHDRMPAILPQETFDAWLDCKRTPADVAAAFLMTAPDNLFEAIEVNPRLNNPRNDGPEVQEPVAAQKPLL